ncbi:MAG: hypothetical protein JNM21_10475 [Taibaiella sp.]|nr:hypothetical protein [Taibaiella sp.]
MQNHGGLSNYCKGCGTSNIDAYGCQGNDCVNIRSGCMVEFSLDLDSLHEVSSAHEANAGDQFHELRDSFLLKTNIGQWYITYYYELGKIASDNNMINAGNCVDYLLFAMDIMNIANEIRNGSPTSIPIDDPMKDKALSFLNDFRANITDPIVLGYLDDIEQDLNFFVNQDVAFIRNTIGL